MNHDEKLVTYVNLLSKFQNQDDANKFLSELSVSDRSEMMQLLLKAL